MKVHDTSTEDFRSRIWDLVGGVVTRAEIGVGTMIAIDVDHAGSEGRADHLWLYLADWALLRSDDEILAADMPDDRFDRSRNVMGDLVGAMVLRARFLADNEVHIEFSGQLRLEIWPNSAAYGSGQTLMLLFANGQHVSSFIG